MSAIFKTHNNRFDALKEFDNMNQKERNSKDSEKSNNPFKKSPSMRDEKSESYKKEYSLVESDFPTLAPEPLKKKESKIESITFVEKVKTVNKPDSEAEAEADKRNIIKPGWVSLHQDPQTRRIVWTYGPGTSKEKEKDYEPVSVLNALVETHKKQIAYYDMLWGEGAYEQHYRSPYHDYEYFERLDELDEEMEEK